MRSESLKNSKVYMPAYRIHVVDNTLALLYNSSKSRGLTHQLTRNLSKLVQAEKKRVKVEEMQYRTWDAQSPPSTKDVEKRARDAKKKHGFLWICYVG